MKNWIIRTLGLKGSWKWAKKQMIKGRMVRCKHWSGALKYRVSPEMECDAYGQNPSPSTLLQANYERRERQTEKKQPLWETSNHHLAYEDYTDYEIFNW